MSRTIQPVISFLTDFGTLDGYVGVVKGVILNIASEARIVDLTHQVPAFDIAAGAWILGCAYKFFPQNSIHLAVVDPGVGSQQKGIVVHAEGGIFVGPDNGIFSKILEDTDNWKVQCLDNRRYHAALVSNTFHARDIYGPVAAHIANGVKPDEIGSSLDPSSLVRLPVARLKQEKERIEGEVVYVDHFGNLITNVPGYFLSRTKECFVNKKICPIAKTYWSETAGQVTAFSGSHGYVEIGSYKARACDTLRARRGAKVVLEILS